MLYKNTTKKLKTKKLFSFFCPKTFILKKNPKYKKNTIYLKKNCVFNLIKYPIATESAMKKIQCENTIVLIVDPKTTKKNIYKAVRTLYKTLPIKITTLFQTNGEKKAFVRLAPNYDALDIANKISLI